MEAKKREHPVYTEQYKSQAVELMIHSGKSVVQIARELGCSEASLHGWKKAYLKGQQPGQIDGQQQSPEPITYLPGPIRSRLRNEIVSAGKRGHLNLPSLPSKTAEYNHEQS